MTAMPGMVAVVVLADFAALAGHVADRHHAVIETAMRMRT